MEDLRTSEEWTKSQEFVGLVILDPDGWQRRSELFQKEFYEDKISRQEFEQRLMSSTILWRSSKI